MFGASFHDNLDGPWEQAKGYLRETLEQLIFGLNSMWSEVFNSDNTLLASSVDGDPTSVPQYVSNTGINHDLKWAKVDVETGVTGRLQFSHFEQASQASILLGRGSAAGAGDFQEITLGTNLAMSGTVLNAGSGSGTVTNTGALTDHALIVGNGGVDVSALASLGTTTTVLHGNASGDPTFGSVSLTADVSGDLPLSSFAQASAASRLLGRGSASGAGDFQEITLGTGLSMAGTVLSSSGTGSSWVPSVDGSEPPNFITDGAGNLIFVAYP